MKKLKLFLVGLILLGATGCMRVNSNMTINKDKSMDLDIVTAVSNELMKALESEGESENTFKVSDDDKKKAEESGYTISEYNKDNYQGIELKKHISNIDDISTEKKITGKLDAVTTSGETKEGSKYLFTVKKGLIKNKYIATIDSSNEKDTSKTVNDYDLSEEEKKEYEALMKTMEIKFNVTLPNKPLSSNATDISNDGKTLTWDFLKNANINKIEFTFELVNTANVVIILSIIVIVLISIIIIFYNIKKGNKPDKPKVIEEQEKKEDTNNYNDIDKDKLMDAQVKITEEKEENNDIHIEEYAEEGVNNEKSFFDMYKPSSNIEKKENDNQKM